MEHKMLGMMPKGGMKEKEMMMSRKEMGKMNRGMADKQKGNKRFSFET